MFAVGVFGVGPYTLSF